MSSRGRHVLRRAAAPLYGLFFLLAILVQGCAPAETGADDWSGMVVDVVDGDTIKVVVDGRTENVRLIGIDTPETHGRNVQPYGPEAEAFTTAHLDGRQVWLQTDVEERDRYGRLLAYVWTSNPDTVKNSDVRAAMFNAYLVSEGYAQVYTVPPNIRYQDVFLQCQEEARRDGLGLWSVPVATEPYYVGNAASKKFHRPDCRWSKQIKPANRVLFDTRTAALDAGFSPCRECSP